MKKAMKAQTLKPSAAAARAAPVKNATKAKALTKAAAAAPAAPTKQAMKAKAMKAMRRPPAAARDGGEAAAEVATGYSSSSFRIVQLEQEAIEMRRRLGFVHTAARSVVRAFELANSGVRVVLRNLNGDVVYNEIHGAVDTTALVRNAVAITLRVESDAVLLVGPSGALLHGLLPIGEWHAVAGAFQHVPDDIVRHVLQAEVTTVDVAATVLQPSTPGAVDEDRVRGRIHRRWASAMAGPIASLGALLPR